MDITKELQDVKKSKTYLTTIIDDLENQKEEISKKIHLLRIINLVNVVEEFLKQDAFKKNDINTIRIWNTFEDDIGYKIGFEYLDKEGNLLIRFGEDGNYIEPVMALQSIFYNLQGYNSLYIGEGFKENSKVAFKIEKGCEEKFFDLLLSKELKSIFQYSNLQSSIVNNNTFNTKKVKL